ncbi:hypothetical protein [Actinoplanes regularis]|uniref:hypothetical protein n=1 Tax=Actinoplanes regularis TaxID=52697 RepID=UPI0024A45B68|nr:hypothetical protein [Actinoplanes regularis]GLW28898.1 hypothetical protein Areg01_18380 [Actinoplanes regularis]
MPASSGELHFTFDHLAHALFTTGRASVTTLFCREKLGVRHLLHVSRYAAQNGVEFDHCTKRRPDLFGPFTDGWLVAEAKGRGGAVDARVRAAARCQKRTIETIGGIVPKLALGCLAYFPVEDDGLTIQAVDPDADAAGNEVEISLRGQQRLAGCEGRRRNQ